MLVLPITFKDLDGKEITEDFRFALSKAELIEIKLIAPDNAGFDGAIRKISKTTDRKELIALFKDIIGMSVGRVVEGDNRRFQKSPLITAEFMETDAYSVLFLSFFEDTNNAVNFMKGVVPKELTDVILKDVDVSNLVNGGDTVEDTRPAWIREDREPTSKELIGMSKEQLVELHQRKASAK